MIAQCVLPIGKDTIKYGSSDGGVTVHNDISVLKYKMKLIAKYLKLKKHKVGILSPKSIYGPGDIEGHKGYDGRYYLIDFARMMPPEAPSKFLLYFYDY